MDLVVEEPFGTAPLYTVHSTLNTILAAAGYTFAGNWNPGDGITRNWYHLHLRTAGFMDAISNHTIDFVRFQSLTGGIQPRISDVWPGVQLGPSGSGNGPAPYVHSTGPCSGFTFSDIVPNYLTVGFIKNVGTSNITIRFSSNGSIFNVTWPIL